MLAAGGHALDALLPCRGSEVVEGRAVVFTADRSARVGRPVKMSKLNRYAK
jgi:hypothetical protein